MKAVETDTYAPDGTLVECRCVAPLVLPSEPAHIGLGWDEASGFAQPEPVDIEPVDVDPDPVP